MIPIDAFIALYDALPGSDEIELQFFASGLMATWLSRMRIVPYSRPMGMTSTPGFRFRLFGDLIAADLPDGIRLARDWDELEVVIVDSTWVLPNEWDIADLEKRFSISLG